MEKQLTDDEVCALLEPAVVGRTQNQLTYLNWLVHEKVNRAAERSKRARVTELRSALQSRSAATIGVLGVVEEESTGTPPELAAYVDFLLDGGGSYNLETSLRLLLQYMNDCRLKLDDDELEHLKDQVIKSAILSIPSAQVQQMIQP